MADSREFEELTSEELHRRAVRLAVHRLDAVFLWRLLRAIPAAEAARGHVDKAETDVFRLSALVGDLLRSGEGELADELRPLYVDYLTQHGR
ncbi:MAG: hypothetical protein ACRDPT_08530 [Streptomycetales bacterium]